MSTSSMVQARYRPRWIAKWFSLVMVFFHACDCSGYRTPVYIYANVTGNAVSMGDEPLQLGDYVVWCESK